MRPERRCDSLIRFLSDFIARSLTVLTSFPGSLLVNNLSIPLNLSGGFSGLPSLGVSRGLPGLSPVDFQFLLLCFLFFFFQENSKTALFN